MLKQEQSKSRRPLPPITRARSICAKPPLPSEFRHDPKKLDGPRVPPNSPEALSKPEEKKAKIGGFEQDEASKFIQGSRSKSVFGRKVASQKKQEETAQPWSRPQPEIIAHVHLTGYQSTSPIPPRTPSEKENHANGSIYALQKEHLQKTKVVTPHPSIPNVSSSSEEGSPEISRGGSATTSPATSPETSPTFPLAKPCALSLEDGEKKSKHSPTSSLQLPSFKKLDPHNLKGSKASHPSPLKRGSSIQIG
jgi:hypothetical protein